MEHVFCSVRHAWSASAKGARVSFAMRPSQLILIILFVLSVGCARDAQQMGATAPAAPAIIWTEQLPGQIIGVAGFEDFIYISWFGPSKEGRGLVGGVRAHHITDGKVRWEWSPGQGIPGSPVATEDSILVPTGVIGASPVPGNSNLLALSRKSGTEMWTQKLGGDSVTLAVPPVWSQGKLWVISRAGSGKTQLEILGMDGTTRHGEVDLDIGTTPAFAASLAIVDGADGVTAIDVKDLRICWTNPTRPWMDVLADEGTAVIVTRENKLVFVNARDGKTVGAITLPGKEFVLRSIFCRRPGEYICASEKSVFLIKRDGSLGWLRNLDSVVEATALGDNTLVLADRKVSLLNSKNGESLWGLTIDGSPQYTWLGPNRTIIVALESRLVGMRY